MKSKKSKSKSEDVEDVKFVVASQVKSYVTGRGYCSGNDLLEALSHRVQSMLEMAMTRTSFNKRRTIRAEDL